MDKTNNPPDPKVAAMLAKIRAGIPPVVDGGKQESTPPSAACAAEPKLDGSWLRRLAAWFKRHIARRCADDGNQQHNTPLDAPIAAEPAEVTASSPVDADGQQVNTLPAHTVAAEPAEVRASDPVDADGQQVNTPPADAVAARLAQLMASVRVAQSGERDNIPLESVVAAVIAELQASAPVHHGTKPDYVAAAPPVLRRVYTHLGEGGFASPLEREFAQNLVGMSTQMLAFARRVRGWSDDQVVPMEAASGAIQLLFDVHRVDWVKLGTVFLTYDERSELARKAAKLTSLILTGTITSTT